MGVHRTFCLIGTRGSFSRVKGEKREGVYSLSPNAAVNNAWRYTSLPLFSFMMYTGTPCLCTPGCLGTFVTVGSSRCWFRGLMMIFAGLASLFLQRQTIFLNVCLHEVHLTAIKLENIMAGLFQTWSKSSLRFRRCLPFFNPYAEALLQHQHCNYCYHVCNTKCKTILLFYCNVRRRL